MKQIRPTILVGGLTLLGFVVFLGAVLSRNAPNPIDAPVIIKETVETLSVEPVGFSNMTDETESKLEQSETNPEPEDDSVAPETEKALAQFGLSARHISPILVRAEMKQAVAVAEEQ